MWPLEKKASSTEVLRVGRLAVERWLSTEGAWALAARQALPAMALGAPLQMDAAIAALYAERPAAAVTIVVESAWLPVVLAGTGGQLLSQRQARELVRHRLGMLRGHAVSSWDVRGDFKIGERFVLGFGCAPDLTTHLRTSVQSLGTRTTGLLPAFLWGWRALPTREGWWLWQEQDRWLAACFHAGRVLGLNAALAPTTDEGRIERLIDVEALRLGLGGAPRSIDAAVWSGAPRAAQGMSRVTWRSLSAPQLAEVAAQLRSTA